MGTKYFAWSFDDGLEQDKKIIRILKKYGMGATFHLNSGLFGDRTYEGRIGNLGMTEMPADRYERQRRHILPYVPHFRIPEDEVRQVYEGFEIASHTRNHVKLTRCSESERIREIREDKESLCALFGQEVTGFAFPYGAGAGKSRQALQAAGIQYARLAVSRPTFRFPEDPLAMPLTCWHISAGTMKRVQEFVRMDTEEDLFFLMFGHGYEFDFGTRESNWRKFERICKTVAEAGNIECCSIGEALRRHKEEGNRK